MVSFHLFFLLFLFLFVYFEIFEKSVLSAVVLFICRELYLFVGAMFIAALREKKGLPEE